MAILTNFGDVARLALLGALVIGCLWCRRKRAQLALLPPSPGLPWPASYPHLEFAKWMKIYGPMITVKRGRDTVVIIGDHEAAADILVRQGASTIDRPHWVAANEILARNTRIVSMSSHPNLKKYRRLLNTYLSLKAVKTFAPLQLHSAKAMIYSIYEDPARHQHHAGTYASTVILSLTYGKTTPTESTDPEVRQTVRSRDRLFAAMVPRAVERFHFLKHVPFYARDLRRDRELELVELNGPVDLVRKAMAEGRALPSLTKHMLENQKEFGLDEEDIMSVAGAMFGAGSYTTAVGISTTIMAAALFPEEQHKVQEELDLVVGKHRAPTFDYETQLSRVEAFALEVARWRPVLPGGFPHRVNKDITWKSYRIPAGTLVQGSHWSVGNDPAVFPDPERFDPSRWLTEKGTIRTDINSFPYGFGRRICPGMHLANRSLWINTALLLWAFEISEIPDKPLDSFGFTDEFQPTTLPYVVDFKLRHSKSVLDSALKDFGSDWSMHATERA